MIQTKLLTYQLTKSPFHTYVLISPFYTLHSVIGMGKSEIFEINDFTFTRLYKNFIVRHPLSS